MKHSLSLIFQQNWAMTSQFIDHRISNFLIAVQIITIKIEESISFVNFISLYQRSIENTYFTSPNISYSLWHMATNFVPVDSPPWTGLDAKASKRRLMKMWSWKLWSWKHSFVCLETPTKLSLTLSLWFLCWRNISLE